MTPKGTLGLLYTNIAQLMTHATVVYVAAYLAIVTKPFGILQRVIKSQRVTCIDQNVSTTVPHPFIFWAYRFLKVSAFNAYHSHIEEVKAVDI